MVRALLARGLVAGLIAGLLAGGFALAFGESRIDAAIAVEHAHAALPEPAHSALPEHAHSALPEHAHDHKHSLVHGHARAHGDELVSRDGQRAGLVLATSLYGLGMGGLFALAFAASFGRLGPADPWRLAAGLGVALFAALVLVPMVKYPANPPAVGQEDTIGRRTELYLVLLACSLVSLVAAARATRLVAQRLTAIPPAVAGALVFVGSVTAACLLLPAVDEVPASFSADLLWDFRMSSLGTQAVLWSVLAVGFGLLARRLLAERETA